MSTNTIRHVSDDSAYKIFNPVGTSFPSNITNVQAALAAIKPIALTGIPNATQSVVGISRFGTQAEIDAGTSTTVAVSPATLKNTVTKPIASTTVVGITRYATDAETTAGNISNAAVVPSSLKLVLNATVNSAINTAFTTRQATELALGVAKIATTPAAIAGQDDVTIMTPKKVALAISEATKKIPTYGTATTVANGLTRIATNGEVQAGTIVNGVSVSPAGLKSLTATTARTGLIALATQGEVSAGTVDTKAITPATLLSRTGAVNRLGLLKLTTTVGSGDGNTALAYNADVVHTRGGQTINGALNTTGSLGVGGSLSVTGATTIGGNVNIAGSLTRGGQQVVTVDMIGDDVPVGVVMMWVSNAALPAKWRDLDGWTGYTQQSHPELWRVHPGGLPDMRGLFPRGVGAGSHITGAQGTDDKGKPLLGNGCGAGGVGTVQAQMVRTHKHESSWGEYNARSDGRNGATVRRGYTGSKKTDWDNYKYFTNDGTEVEAENIRDSFGTMNSRGLMGQENRPWNMAVRFIIKIA